MRMLDASTDKKKMSMRVNMEMASSRTRHECIVGSFPNQARLAFVISLFPTVRCCINEILLYWYTECASLSLRTATILESRKAVVV